MRSEALLRLLRGILTGQNHPRRPPGGGSQSSSSRYIKRPLARWEGSPFGVTPPPSDLGFSFFQQRRKIEKKRKKEAPCLPSHSKESFSPTGSGRTPRHAAGVLASICPALVLALSSGAEDRPTLCRIASAFHARGRECTQDRAGELGCMFLFLYIRQRERGCERTRERL